MAESNENLVTQTGVSNSEEVTTRVPDGTEATPETEIDRIRKALKNKLRNNNIPENYKYLTKVLVFPRVDGKEVKVTNDSDNGRGFLNEYNVRQLFDENAVYERGCGYFVFHEHYFRSKELKTRYRALFHDELRIPYNNSAELTGFSKEDDFVLLHPTRGLIIAEVKAYADHNNFDGFEGIFNTCKTQCSQGFLCMKAYVKHMMQLNDPSGFNETEVKQKLNSLFKKFSHVLIFPSLSNQVLENQDAGDFVKRLDANIKIFFKEDLEQKSNQMRKTIEDECFIAIPVEDQVLYSDVYDISLYCCVFMTKGIRIKDFTSEERSKTRKEYFQTMEKTFFDYKQMVVRTSEDKILFVEGFAGSGKSLICWAKMFHIAESNPRHAILYLCYNRILADKVRDVLEDRKRNTTDGRYNKIEVHDLMSWLRELCGKVGGQMLPRNREIRYAEILRGNRMRQQELRAKYKNVFIDEYHDLAPKTRALLEYIFMSRFQVDPNAEGSFCVFYDNLQRVLYLQEKIKDPETVIVPENVSVHYLSTVYRTPYYVTNYFMKYAKNITYDMKLRSLGPPVQIKCVTSEGNKQELLDSLLDQTIEELKERHKLLDKEITVLFKSKIIRDRHRKRHLSFICGRYSVFEFKGLENEAVIYYDPPVVMKPKKVDHCVGQHYTAGSRALWIYVLLVKSEKDKNRLEEIMNQGVYGATDPTTATFSGFRA